MVYRAWGSWLGHAQTGSIVRNLMDGLDAPAYPHLWFLWVIASLYLLTPIFQPFAVRGSVSTHIYFVSLWFLVTAIVPLFERWSGIKAGLQLDAVTGFIGYYILGVSLRRFTTERLNTRRFTICWLTFLSCSAITAGGAYALSQGEGRGNESMMDASAGNIILMSLAAFLLLRHYGTQWANAREATVWRASLTRVAL